MKVGYKGQMGPDAAVFFCPYMPGHVKTFEEELDEFWAGVERILRARHRQEEYDRTIRRALRRAESDH